MECLIQNFFEYFVLRIRHKGSTNLFCFKFSLVVRTNLFGCKFQFDFFILFCNEFFDKIQQKKNTKVTQNKFFLCKTHANEFSIWCMIGYCS